MLSSLPFYIEWHHPDLRGFVLRFIKWIVPTNLRQTKTINRFFTNNCHAFLRTQRNNVISYVREQDPYIGSTSMDVFPCVGAGGKTLSLSSKPVSRDPSDRTL